MRPIHRRAFLVGLTIPFAGCDAPTAAATYEGRYSWGFEESAFTPCGRDERWWVSNDAEVVDRYREVTDDEYEQVYARLRGRLSVPGTYGHLGEYSRELNVTGVVEIRALRPDDC